MEYALQNGYLSAVRYLLDWRRPQRATFEHHSSPCRCNSWSTRDCRAVCMGENITSECAHSNASQPAPRGAPSLALAYVDLGIVPLIASRSVVPVVSTAKVSGSKP